MTRDRKLLVAAAALLLAASTPLLLTAPTTLLLTTRQARTTGTPTTVPASASSNGVSDSFAKVDHTHAGPVCAVGQLLGVTGAADGGLAVWGCANSQSPLITCANGQIPIAIDGGWACGAITDPGALRVACDGGQCFGSNTLLESDFCASNGKCLSATDPDGGPVYDRTAIHSYPCDGGLCQVLASALDWQSSENIFEFYSQFNGSVVFTVSPVAPGYCWNGFDAGTESNCQNAPTHIVYHTYTLNGQGTISAGQCSSLPLFVPSGVSGSAACMVSPDTNVPVNLTLTCAIGPQLDGGSAFYLYLNVCCSTSSSCVLDSLDDGGFAKTVKVVFMQP